MASLANALKEEVGRIVQQEVRRQMAGTTKASAQSQREIAALTRQIQRLQRELSSLRGQEAPKQPGSKKKTARKTETSEKENGKAAAAVSDKQAIRRRFSPEGLKKHRKTLDLSADNYGRLIGVSGLSIYNWESGKARPRDSSIEALMQIRELGKRAAAKRLEELDGQDQEASGQDAISSDQEAGDQEASRC